METRTLVLVVAAVVLIVACSALAAGWMGVAEQATAETQLCERKHRRRVADLPRIVVGHELLYRGEVMVPVSVLRQATQTDVIDPLYARLVRDQRNTCDASRICLDNMIVLQIDTSIDRAIVNQIVNTAWAAGFDVVASPLRNTTW